MKHAYDNVTEDTYFRKVLRNMRLLGDKECSVQFGETGQGIAPNYMITDKNGAKYIFHGLGHGRFVDFSAEQFTEDKLSPPLSWADLVKEIDTRSKSKERKPN
jgi:hypothetical protein